MSFNHHTNVIPSLYISKLRLREVKHFDQVQTELNPGSMTTNSIGLLSGVNHPSAETVLRKHNGDLQDGEGRIVSREREQKKYLTLIIK